MARARSKVIAAAVGAVALGAVVVNGGMALAADQPPATDLAITDTTGLGGFSDGLTGLPTTAQMVMTVRYVSGAMPADIRVVLHVPGELDHVQISTAHTTPREVTPCTGPDLLDGGDELWFCNVTDSDMQDLTSGTYRSILVRISATAPIDRIPYDSTGVADIQGVTSAGEKMPELPGRGQDNAAVFDIAT